MSRLDPLKYPQSPGYSHRPTSRAAAEKIKSRALTLRESCLYALRQIGNQTADEIAEALGESILAVRPRITELAKLDQIIDTEQRRKNKSGRLAIVWKAKGKMD